MEIKKYFHLIHYSIPKSWNKLQKLYMLWKLLSFGYLLLIEKHLASSYEEEAFTEEPGQLSAAYWGHNRYATRTQSFWSKCIYSMNKNARRIFTYCTELSIRLITKWTTYAHQSHSVCHNSITQYSFFFQPFYEKRSEASVTAHRTHILSLDLSVWRVSKFASQSASHMVMIQRNRWTK